MWYLAYSKTTGDNRPLKSFQTGPHPCLNTELSPVQKNKTSNIYPLEFDFSTEHCEVKDDRYTKLSDNYTVSLYDLQADNGIQTVIESLPLYEVYVDTDLKQESE